MTFANLFSTLIGRLWIRAIVDACGCLYCRNITKNLTIPNKKQKNPHLSVRTSAIP